LFFDSSSKFEDDVLEGKIFRVTSSLLVFSHFYLSVIQAFNKVIL
jgi:hypothetical protein